MYLKFGHEQSPLGDYEWPLTRIVLAQRFQGWTLDTIDGLSQREVGRIFGVLKAQQMIQDEKRNK